MSVGADAANALLLEKRASSRISKFLRTAPEDKLRPAIEGIIGSSPMSPYTQNPQTNALLKYFRGGGDEYTPAISRLNREDVVKLMRKRMAAPPPNTRSYDLGDLKMRPPSLNFARSILDRAASPSVTVSHGGTEPELQSIMKYGPNALVPNVYGAAGKDEISGLFVHKPTDALTARVPSYAARRTAYAGGAPARLEFEIPEKLLQEVGRIGGGEHVVPTSLWRFAKNPRVIKL
jgi:hypothetical protein